MRARSFRLPKPLLAIMLITLIAVAALPGQAGATPAPGTLLWARKLTASSGGLNSVAVAPDGQTVFVTGSAANELVTAAYTSSGTKLWLKTHTGTNCCIDAGRSIVVSPDGASVFVTGNTGVVDGTIDVVTIGYDVATGVELWTKVYDRGSMDGDGTTTSQHDYGEAIGISPDGATVYVAAETQYVLDSTIHADYGTLAYNAVTGHRQWASFYDGGVGSDSPRSLIVSPDGATVYVTGYSASAQSSAITTVAYDTSDGTQIWAQPFEGPAGQNDTGWSLAMKPDGSAVYVTGGTGGTGNGTGDWDMVTMALDTTDGSVLWDKLYNSPSDGYDFGRSVTVDSAGKRVYVMGHSLGTTGNYDITTLAYDAETGKRAWVERAPGPSVNLGLTGGVAVTPDGTKIVVASYRVRSGQNDTSTISYSASGALRWKQSYNVADVDRLTSVAISPNGGRAFVAGYTANDTILAYKV
jgi:outer membrane protein assembly factor BamB